MNQPMPMPPWFWFPMNGPNQLQQPVADVVAPARVNKALEFIALISQKTMTRVAVNDMSIEQIPGQKLTDEEEIALATACNLLSGYFSGKLNPDIWESIKVDAARRQAEHGAGRLMYCLACAPGPAKPNCPLCEGTGKIMITAVGNLPTNDDQAPPSSY